MDRDALKAVAKELAKGLKTEADLTTLMGELLKLSVETALSAELTEHLGYEKHASGVAQNRRNGSTPKTVMSHHGEIEIETPRDRDGTFLPLLVKKQQTRVTQMDDQILSLTDAVKERVIEWQSRPLDAIYPIIYLDCIVVKVHQEGSVINKAVFLALGINMEGHKELLGMWISENEGAKFLAGGVNRIKKSWCARHIDCVR
jgi:putative transposase